MGALRTSCSIVIEARDNVTAYEVFHVALDGQVAGKFNERPISDNHCTLKHHRQLFIHLAIWHGIY